MIRQQAGLLLHCSNLYYHEYQGKLAERIAKASGLQRSFFCNSGAEAIEGGLKMIRSHGHAISPEKFEIVSLEGSFHGRTPQAFQINADLEFQRNRERYMLLRWGQTAFSSFHVVPPDTGIVHQINLEYLARSYSVRRREHAAYPDSLVGTDSHTTMVNGLGVLGWGVGGIEAEAALLGQPVSMLAPAGGRIQDCTGTLPRRLHRD